MRSAKWWRYRLAYLLDKLPGMCWTKLVLWVECGRVHPIRDIRIDTMCHRDAERCTYCYCGKLHRPGAPKRIEDYAEEPPP